MERMKVGKYYKITSSFSNSFAPELSPQGTIVRCIEDCSTIGMTNGYKIRLEDSCGKVLRQKKGFVQGWLFHTSNEKNTYEEISIRDLRKLKLRRVNERSEDKKSVQL